MLMHKCDRCGKIYNHEHNQDLDKYSVEVRKPGTFGCSVDLCDDCRESIRQWMIDPNATIAYDPATEKPDYSQRTTVLDYIRKLFNIDEARDAAEKLKEIEK